jgi:hypothetical protein
MTGQSDNELDKPVWDDQFAAALLGKVVLVGITRLDHLGTEVDREQFYGVVTSAAQGEGIELALRGSQDGRRFRLPPTTGCLRQAKPGQYRLRRTGEVVQDPKDPPE